jgi:type IV secretory pathway VirB10-like protein
MVLDFLTENPWLFTLIILAIFGVIVLAVILAKKYIPAFKSKETPKSDQEIAEEEVKRLTEPMDEETAAKNAPADEKKPDEGKDEKKPEDVPPSRRDAAEFESKRATEEADEDFQKQAEAYQKAHEAEDKAALEKADSEEKK